MNRFRYLAAILTAAGVSCLLPGTALAGSYESGHRYVGGTYHYQKMRSPQHDIEREHMRLQSEHDRLQRQQEQLQHRQERAHRDFNRSRNYMGVNRKR